MTPTTSPGHLLTGWAGHRGMRRRILAHHAVRTGDTHLSIRVWLELTATVLESGVPLAEALRIVAESAESSALQGVAHRLRLGLPWDAAWPPEAPSREGNSDERQTMRILREVLTLAVRTGAPTASMLRARAMQLRRSEHREAEKVAAALGVKLVVPLGLCSLPSFVCLGVVPILIGFMPRMWS